MRTCEPGNVGIIPPDIAYMFKRSCFQVLVLEVATLIGSDSRDFINRVSLIFASRPGYGCGSFGCRDPLSGKHTIEGFDPGSE